MKHILIMPQIFLISSVACSANAQTAARRLEGIRPRGGNISNIDGLIRANGSANLFLINPAGIVFGEGARLDIGGSFYGSSASSILFEDGEYNAVDNLEQPILTINAPIGLNFRDEPGDIVNRSFAQNSAGDFVGLEVNALHTLALIGGDINFEAGEVTARGGNIFLSGLNQAGTVSFNKNGSLSVPENLTLANIALTNAADVDVRGTGGGNINIKARNLTLAAGEFGSSLIRGGITANSTSIEAQAGDITINVAENISLNDSGIVNQVSEEGVGNSGNIVIDTGSLELTNRGAVDATTFGTGNAGEVNVTARGDIAADGRNSQGFSSAITSGVDSGAEGDAGDITIFTTNLNLTNGGRVATNTLGTGNAGEVSITARGDITVDGEDSQNPSGIASGVNPDAVGSSGGVTIYANNLNLINGGAVDTSTFGRGNAGNLTIDATESIFISGIQDARAGISANAVVDEGEGGDINITTDRLTITDNGIIEASNFDFLNNFEPGTGEPGNITIQAVNLDLSDGGTIGAATQSTEGTSGLIDLDIAQDITLDGDSFISAQAFEDANGGNLNIDARFIVAFPSNGTGNDLIAAADRGIGGNISLNVEQVFGLSQGRAIDRGNIIPSFNGTNNIDVTGNVDGSLNINATNIDPLQGATELPANIVQPSETTQQACAANREAEAKNGLNIVGKGGVPPAPELPLNSLNAISNGEINPTPTIPAPIETSQGKIQPARGIEVTPEGVIRLTAYRTDNAGDRLPEIKQNCG